MQSCGLSGTARLILDCEGDEGDDTPVKMFLAAMSPRYDPERRWHGDYSSISSGDVRRTAPPRRGAYSSIRREQMGYIH